MRLIRNVQVSGGVTLQQRTMTLNRNRQTEVANLSAADLLNRFLGDARHLNVNVRDTGLRSAAQLPDCLHGLRTRRVLAETAAVILDKPHLPESRVVRVNPACDLRLAAVLERQTRLTGTHWLQRAKVGSLAHHRRGSLRQSRRRRRRNEIRVLAVPERRVKRLEQLEVLLRLLLTCTRHTTCARRLTSQRLMDQLKVSILTRLQVRAQPRGGHTVRRCRSGRHRLTNRHTASSANGLVGLCGAWQLLPVASATQRTKLVPIRIRAGVKRNVNTVLERPASLRKHRLVTDSCRPRSVSVARNLDETVFRTEHVRLDLVHARQTSGSLTAQTLRLKQSAGNVLRVLSDLESLASPAHPVDAGLRLVHDASHRRLGDDVLSKRHEHAVVLHVPERPVTPKLAAHHVRIGAHSKDRVVNEQLTAKLFGNLTRRVPLKDDKLAVLVDVHPLRERRVAASGSRVHDPGRPCEHVPVTLRDLLKTFLGQHAGRVVLHFHCGFGAVQLDHHVVQTVRDLKHLVCDILRKQLVRRVRVDHPVRTATLEVDVAGKRGNLVLVAGERAQLLRCTADTGVCDLVERCKELLELGVEDHRAEPL